MSLMVSGAFLGIANLTLLSDRIAIDLDPASATVSWKFYLDGHLAKIQGGSETTPSTQEWYSSVTANIGNSYDVRCKEILSGPTAFTAQGAAIGTYVQISVTRTWTYTNSSQPPGDSIVATFQIVATGTTTPILAQADLTFSSVVLS